MMLLISKPAECRARTAESRPGPGPFTRISSAFTPNSCAARPALSDATWAANGVLVNGKRVNIPAYQLSAQDVVEVSSDAKEQLRVKAALEAAEQRGFPEWLEVDSKGMKGTFKAVPERREMPGEINEQLVIALYSK